MRANAVSTNYYHFCASLEVWLLKAVTVASLVQLTQKLEHHFGVLQIGAEVGHSSPVACTWGASPRHSSCHARTRVRDGAHLPVM
eukprot:scaffold4647_cov393-Prasinococcus_capsulatus_cf.AAC.10